MDWLRGRLLCETLEGQGTRL